MKSVFSFILAALLITACGSDNKEQDQQQQAPPRVNIPIAEEDIPDGETESAAQIEPVESLDDETLPDLSKLSEVEQQIFLETVRRQVAYYDALEKWAKETESIKGGDAAAASVRRYIALQEAFARQLRQLDTQFAGRIDPDYAGSPEFAKVLDEYLGRPELIKQTEYIMTTYAGMLQKYRDDPAFKEVYAEIERLAREAQQEMMQNAPPPQGAQPPQPR